MNAFTDGYIKFNCLWTKNDFDFPVMDLKGLNHWRDRMYMLKLIGAYPDGVGYGNISARKDQTPLFIISGSATGNFPILGKEHYALVTEYNFNLNSLSCTGRVKASSESLSHAVIYDRCEQVNSIIHIHNNDLWIKLKDKIPTTSESVEYGTPGMAEEIYKVIEENNLKKQGMIIMGGHKDGIIAFGDSMDNAGNIILEKLDIKR